MSPKQEENKTHIALNFPHNTPLPYNSSSENIIIAARELAYALKNPAPQAPFSNIGDSHIAAIEKLSKIFSKAANNLKITAEPPQQQPEKKPPLYLRNCSQGGLNLSPHYIPMSLDMRRGRNLQITSTRSTFPHQVQSLFSLNSLTHLKGRTLQNLQG